MSGGSRGGERPTSRPISLRSAFRVQVFSLRDMSQRRLIQLLVSVMMWGAFCSIDLAQDCKSSGKPAWNASTFYVAPDCPVEFPSPNHRLLLKFASDGTMSIKGMTVHLSVGLRLPTIMVSWSPRSDAFFI